MGNLVETLWPYRWSPGTMFVSLLLSGQLLVAVVHVVATFARGRGRTELEAFFEGRCYLRRSATLQQRPPHVASNSKVCLEYFRGVQMP